MFGDIYHSLFMISDRKFTATTVVLICIYKCIYMVHLPGFVKTIRAIFALIDGGGTNKRRSEEEVMWLR